MTAAIIMFAVALVCGSIAFWLFARTARTDASVYRNRIGATMLGAGAIILVAYAAALWSWSV